MVTDQLGITLGGTEKGKIDLQPTDNLEAYQAYLRGRYWATRPHFTHEDWERAMAAYQQAAELDPNFALAHAHLARGHARARFFRHDLTPERLDAAEAAAAKAVELAPNSPRVRLALGYYQLWAYRDVEGALAEFERAGGELVGSADVLAAMGSVFILQGQWEEALRTYRRAFELSPRDVNLILHAGWALSTMRRYPEALVAFDHSINLAPDMMWPYLYKAINDWGWHGKAGETRSILEAFPNTTSGWERWSWYWQEMYEGRYSEALGRIESTSEGWIRIKMIARPNALLAAYAYEKLGDEEEAAAAYEIARELLETEVAASLEDPRLHSSLGIVHAAQGRHEDAVREGMLACDLLPRSKDGFYYLPYVIDLAHIYTILGDNEAALERLEYLLSNPSYLSSPFLRMDPRWDPLRDDPRFHALLENYEIAQ
jgi:serine/threonine-protein kinase